MSKKLLANVGNAVADNYRRYYQEYEGTFITATDKSEDDTLDTSRYIEVTEIFGNTIQDENNLEDIQSVGELYVDEQGEPILDDLGREQYKIEIESCNYKRLYTNEEIVELYNNMGYSNVKAEYTQDGLFKLTNNGGWFNPNKVFKGKPNTEYTFYTPGITSIYTHGLTLVKKYSNDFYAYRTDSTGEFGYLIQGDIGIAFDFKIYEGNISNIENITEKSHKTTILLPCQLQKVGNVYDRLYWDSEKCRYVVEKKVEETILDGNIRDATTSNGHNLYKMIVNKLRANDETIIIQGLKSVTRDAIENYSVYTFTSWSWFWFKLDDSEIDKTRASNFIEGRKCIFTTSIPQLIETNITEKILLPCYEEKTHIFVNSTVDVTMKALVPYKEII